MLKRMLIVSPHFPPVNTPDLHRVRVLLPFLRDNGWEAEVLAVAPRQVASPEDPWLLEGLPPWVPVHRVHAMGLGWSWLPGFGNLGLRALLPLRRTGDGLLGKGTFDLVYFSTTVFEVHLLGPRWLRRFGVPFVMDYQDPWVNDYYREHPALRPPGGRVKYAFADALHRWMEPRVLRHCAGITSVSADYPPQIENRYPWFRGVPQLVETFSGAAADFARLRNPGLAHPRFDPNDGSIHWVYVGVVVPMMDRSLRAFFSALRDHGTPALLGRLQLHFLGTSYAPAGTATPRLPSLAAEYGLGHCVYETPDRIPYAEALRCLMGAHALLAFGTDAEGYTASKIYPCLLAGKPLLAIYHNHSSVVSLIAKVGGAVCVPFASSESEADLAARIADQWLQEDAYARPVPLDEEAFRPHTDAGSAAKLTAFFSDCVASWKARPTAVKSTP